MIKIILFSICLLIIAPVFSQPWLHSPYLTKKKTEANYFEIRDAFYKYWEHKHYQRGNGYKQFKRWEWYHHAAISDIGETVNPYYYWKEKQKFISSASQKNSVFLNSDWLPLGLTAWQNGNSGYNPGNGRLNVAAVSTQNTNTIWVGSPSGGIWKSTDGGVSWNTNFDYQPVIGISAIAIHPANDSIVFIGTGDRDAWDSKSIGIMKTTDGGGTWVQTGLNYSAGYSSINKILFYPGNYNKIMAATGSGITRSTDGGNTWSNVYTSGNVTNLFFNPANPAIMYGCGNSFLKSTNGGNSFHAVTAGLPTQATRNEIAVTPANPAYVYLIASDQDGKFIGVYLSSDTGNTFSLQTSSPNLLGYETDGSDSSGQAWYDLAIEASPVNANEVVIGGVNVWKSTDAGISWTNSSYWYYPYCGQNYTHADIHFLKYFGSNLYCCSDGGLFSSTDDGSSWNNLSTGLGITQFYRMGNSESYPDMIVAGAQDNGCNKFENDQWTHLFGADGFECAVQPGSNSVLYVSYQCGGILKSTDGGNNFNDARPDTNDGAWVTPYLIHPSNPQMLFAAYTDVYLSIDGTGSWQPISSNLTGGTVLEYLAVAPSNPDYIYTSESQNLYYSTNGGQNWQTVVPINGFNITGITVDNINPQRLWLCCTSYSGDKVLYSPNHGISFFDITANLTNLGFRSILHVNNTTDDLFLGTETGVFYKDSTQQWILYNNGLPNTAVNELEIIYGTAKLRAATYGRGIWETDLPAGLVNINSPESKYTLEIFPVPVKKFFIIRTSSTQPFSGYTVFTVSGTCVKHEEFDNPISEATVNTDGWASGTYFVKIKTGETFSVKKFIVQ